MTDQPPCKFLDWDSRFFGVRIGSVAGTRLDPARAAEILRWSNENKIDCLYFLADIEAETGRLARELGFLLVDVRVCLDAEVESLSSAAEAPDDIREAVPADLSALMDIASRSHTDSRFYADRHFPRALCDEFYKTWIRRSLEGFADAVLVAGLPGRPSGYLTCRLEPGPQGRIGLCAVAEDARGQGTGQRLVRGALAWFAQRGIRRVNVITQGRNVAAQRLYQRCGFLTRRVQVYYHLWPSQPEQAVAD